MFANLKLYALAGALLIAFGVGWSGRDILCDAAEAKRLLASAQARIVQLEDNLRKIKVASEQDAARATANAAEIERLEKAIRDAQDKISAGVCFDARDADRVRGLWQ